MARRPRVVLPGQPVHIIQRGNNRQPVFYFDDDYWRYLHDLKLAADEHDCQIHAYVSGNDNFRKSIVVKLKRIKRSLHLAKNEGDRRGAKFSSTLTP